MVRATALVATPARLGAGFDLDQAIAEGRAVEPETVYLIRASIK